jgi:aquaporin related protein
MVRIEKFQPLIAEFIGTMMLSLAVLTTARMFSVGTAPWYISITAGAALFLIVTKLGHVSGAHVNPAVTVGQWSLKKIDTIQAAFYIVFQLFGGATALLLFNFLTDTQLPTATSDMFLWRAFFGEALGGAVFGAGIIAAISKKLDDKYTAVTIGFSLTAGAMLASLSSAGYLNPAVALANNGVSKITMIAPIVGVTFGMQLYTYLFAPQSRSTTRRKK